MRTESVYLTLQYVQGDVDLPTLFFALLLGFGYQHYMSLVPGSPAFDTWEYHSVQVL